MRTSRFTDSQILAILKQNESGVAVPELCREHGMSTAQFYKWRAKFGGMDASFMKRLKELEDENCRLKKMYSEERLKAEICKEGLEGELKSHLSAERWRKLPFNVMVLAFVLPVFVLALARAVTTIKANSATKTL